MENNFNAVLLLKQILEKVKERQLPLIAIRHKEISETMAYSGDYDYFLPKEHMDDVLKIIFTICTQTSSSFTIDRLKYGKTKIKLYNHLDDLSVILEIWNFLDVKDPFKKTLKYILYENLQPYIVQAGDNTFKFSTEVEALYYLSHMYSKNKKLSTELVLIRVQHYKDALQKSGSAYYNLYEDFLAEKRDLKHVAHQANMALVDLGLLALKSNKKVMLDELVIKMHLTLNRLKGQLMRFVKITPVVGPDGVGKTTLINALKEKSSSAIAYYRFKKTYRASPLYKLLYPFLYRSLNKKLAQNVAKNQIDDRYGLFIFINSLLYYPFLVILNLLRNRHLLTDRFFHDSILMNMRFPEERAGLRKNWEMYLRFVPQTYWFMQLDAPNKIIHSRKKELSNDDIDSYRNDVFTMYLQKPVLRYAYINTDTSIDQCSDILVAEGLV